MIEIQKGTGKYTVTLIAVESGEDISVIIYGGEKPHIGAVSISIARPSLENPNNIVRVHLFFTLNGIKKT